MKALLFLWRKKWREEKYSEERSHVIKMKIRRRGEERRPGGLGCLSLFRLLEEACLCSAGRHSGRHWRLCCFMEACLFSGGHACFCRLSFSSVSATLDHSVFFWRVYLLSTSVRESWREMWRWYILYPTSRENTWLFLLFYLHVTLCRLLFLQNK